MLSLAGASNHGLSSAAASSSSSLSADLVAAFRYADSISPRFTPEHRAVLKNQLELTLLTLVFDLKNKERGYLTLTKACENIQASMVKIQEVLKTLQEHLASLKA